MWHVKDLILIFFECNAIYGEDVKDRSNTLKGCNAMYAMYVKDVEDSKRNKRKHNTLDWLYLLKPLEMYIAYIAQ